MHGKLFQKCNVNTDVTAWHGIYLSHKTSIKYSGQSKLLCESSKFNTLILHKVLNKHWSIYSCLQIPPRENWFQYIRRVYATAINFPCTLHLWNQISLYTVRCTVYWTHCTVSCIHVVHCTVQCIHCTLYSELYTPYSVQCTMNDVHYTVCDQSCVQKSQRFIV